MNFSNPNFDQDISIAIIASILGISLPIIVQSINSVDSKYGSTRLINRLIRSAKFKCFIGLLIATLMYRFYYCFLPERSVDWGAANALIDCSGWIVLYLLVALLIAAMVVFSFEVLKYHDPNKLIRTIPNRLADNSDTIDTKSKSDYGDWIEIILSTLDRSKHRGKEYTAFIIYEILYKYVIEENIKCGDSIVEYSSNFYDALRSINRGLCKADKEMSSIFNASTSTNILIESFQNSRISNSTYNCIWVCLQEQLFYNREDLIYDYWKSADQYFSFQLRPLNEDPKRADVINRKSDITRFQLFNCMLGAAVYNQGREDLLKKMFRFSHSTHPLNAIFPQRYDEIVSIFTHIKEITLYSPSFFRANFPFLDIDSGVHTDNIVRHKIENFLALLLFRVHAPEMVISNLRTSSSMPTLPATAADNRALRHTIERIHMLLQDNKSAYNNLLDTTSNLAPQFNAFIKKIDDAYDKILTNQQTNKELINKIYGRIKNGYDEFIKVLKNISQSDPHDCGIEEPIHYHAKHTKDKKQFCRNQEYSASGIEDIYQTLVYHNMAIAFGTLLLNNSTYSVICLYDDITAIIDNMSIDKNRHLIIADNVNWERLGATKADEEGHKYRYKGIEIVSFGSSYLANYPCLWVIERDNLPYIKNAVQPKILNAKNKISDGVYAEIKEDSSERKNCTERIECMVDLCFKREVKLLRIPLVYQFQQMQYTSVENLLNIDDYLA